MVPARGGRSSCGVGYFLGKYFYLTHQCFLPSVKESIYASDRVGVDPDGRDGMKPPMLLMIPFSKVIMVKSSFQNKNLWLRVD
jgi:hypothetical protein